MTTVTRCIENGLASGQRMAVNASLIEADANKQNWTPKKEWNAKQIDPADAPRAIREFLDTLDTTVMEKAIAHPTSARLYEIARRRFVAIAH